MQVRAGQRTCRLGRHPDQVVLDHPSHDPRAGFSAALGGAAEVALRRPGIHGDQVGAGSPGGRHDGGRVPAARVILTCSPRIHGGTRGLRLEQPRCGSFLLATPGMPRPFVDVRRAPLLTSGSPAPPSLIPDGGGHGMHVSTLILWGRRPNSHQREAAAAHETHIPLRVRGLFVALVVEFGGGCMGPKILRSSKKT